MGKAIAILEKGMSTERSEVEEKGREKGNSMKNQKIQNNGLSPLEYWDSAGQYKSDLL